MAIVWFKEDKDLFVTLSKNNIILNKECDKLLEDYGYCILGYDKNAIYLKPVFYLSVDQNEISEKVYKMTSTISYLRVSCTDFLSIITKVFSLDLDNNQKFLAKWSEDDKLLEIIIKDNGGE
ncbi:MAG: hypothetical protein ACK5HL_04055 [Bacilli bacterium]